MSLNVRSSYSLLSSLVKIDELIEKAKEYGYTFLALTDKDVMYGTMEFYNKCKENNIKPIIGLEVNAKIDDETFEVVLLAKNNEGYKALIKISSNIRLNELESIDFLNLKKYQNDLIIIVNCYKETNISLLESYKEKFSNLYLGYIPNVSSKNITSKLEIVLMDKVMYLNFGDEKYLRYVYAIKRGKKITEIEEINNTFYLKPKEELENICPNKKWYENSLKIANLCNVGFSKRENLLPKFPCPKGVSSNDYLTLLCEKGLKKRYKNSLSETHKKRLYYELEIIKKMNYADYFLIVWDYVKYAKQNGILVGPGRGSAAGSLVSYCLGITDVDPIKYNLLFERFLNPERVTMPDIDIDFPDNRRDEVIEYVKNKYGEERVAQIITFGTLGAKQVIRDVGRVLDIPIKLVDRVSKLIPNELNITLKEALNKSKALKEILESSKELKEMYEIAMHLEGIPRHTSVHAAGIVLSEDELSLVLPLEKGEEMNLTQYSMDYLEDIGLLKMDFLGLRNLTILNHIVKLIEASLGKQINIKEISFDDKKTFELFATGDTTGIFQFESSGMRNVLKQVKPTSFEDIVATNALFRPGPMDNILEFVKRKQGKVKIEYIHEDLKEILEPTYGIIVYQEQIMQIANKLAGYSLGEADVLRRAMGKKEVEVLKNERTHFIEKCVQNGYERKIAEEVYDLILKFANYGFNRSHAVSYSVIGYTLAYLKANYPLYFMNALLSSVIGSDVKIREYIMEAKAKNIKILPPDINFSNNLFIPENGKIRYSLAAIRNIGTVAVNTILNERKNGKYKSFFNFVARTYGRGVTRKTLESLIDAGAMDSFKLNRKTLHENLESAINYSSLVQIEKDGQLIVDINLVEPPQVIEKEEFSEQEKLTREYEVLGLYLSFHPINQYLKSDNILIKDIKKYFNKVIEIILYVEEIKVIKTKKGTDMAFVLGNDARDSLEVVLFEEVLKKLENIEKGDVIKVKGRVEKRYDEYQLIANEIEILSHKK